jgi:hypothetical protein
MGATINWIGALFLAALIAIEFALYSDIAITACVAKSFTAAAGLCKLQPERPPASHPAK